MVPLSKKKKKKKNADRSKDELTLCRWFSASGRLIFFFGSTFFSLLAGTTPQSSLQLEVACTWLAGVNGGGGGGGCSSWSCKAVPIIFHSESFLCDFCWPHAVSVHRGNGWRLRRLRVAQDSSANHGWVEMFSHYVSNDDAWSYCLVCMLFCLFHTH